MSTTNEIAEFCMNHNPAMIYLAIGPANAPLQQYPPFLHKFPKPHICIMFDPRLEETLTHERPDGVTFFHLRREFDWDKESGFIEELCQIPSAKMIAQDYSGTDIRKYYPLRRFGPPLLKKVLFDVTYSDGGCFVDFDEIQLFYSEDHGFINPIHKALVAMISDIPAVLAKTIVTERNIAIQFVQALYNIQRGREEARHWCTPENIERRAGWLFAVFDLPPSALEELLIAHIADLSAAISEPIPREYALRLLESKDYMEMATTLASLL